MSALRQEALAKEVDRLKTKMELIKKIEEVGTQQKDLKRQLDELNEAPLHDDVAQRAHKTW